MMKTFLKRNKTIIAVIIGALIVATSIYIVSVDKEEPSSKCLAPSEAMVTKVLDGDTVIVEGGSHVRLLGIDADEKGYPCYKQAKSYLEDLVLNKEVRLEKDQTDVDQYDRCLRYLFLDGNNVNLQLVEQGLAICRFYEPDVKYREQCASIEQQAIQDNLGCKWEGKNEEATSSIKKFEQLTTEKTGLEVVGACQAGNHLGQQMIVEGNVVDGYHHQQSDTIFLNFEKPYPNNCFTAVIFSSDQYKFVQHPEQYYTDNKVRVKGTIEEYEGKPEIILKDPSQIEVGE